MLRPTLLVAMLALTFGFQMGDVPLTRRESLSLFPEAILWDVVEDDQFRDVLGVKLDGVIVFDGDKARFGRATFFDAIREVYRSGDASATVKDADGGETDVEPNDHVTEEDPRRNELIVGAARRPV